MNEEELTGMEEEILYIGDSDQVDIDLQMDLDFIVVNDPRTNEQDDWCILFTDGPYNDWVVKFDNIGINAKTKDLTYQYQVLHAPSIDTIEDRDVDLIDLNNHLTSALKQVLIYNHDRGAVHYTDLETGKDITFNGNAASDSA